MHGVGMNRPESKHQYFDTVCAEIRKLFELWIWPHDDGL